MVSDFESESLDSGIVKAEIAGTSMLVHQLDAGVYGIAAADGKLLWHYPRLGTRQGNVHTALVRGDEVFCSCGWGTGWALLKIERTPTGFEAKEAYFVKGVLDPWLGSSVLLDGVVHTGCGKHIAWKTGEVLEDLRLSRSTLTAADGCLVQRTSMGEVRLTAITEKGYEPMASFKPPRAPGSQPPWSYPIITGGKLWLPCT